MQALCIYMKDSISFQQQSESPFVFIPFVT